MSMVKDYEGNKDEWVWTTLIHVYRPEQNRQTLAFGSLQKI